MELGLVSLKGSAMYSNVVWAVDGFCMSLARLPANGQSLGRGGGAHRG